MRTRLVIVLTAILLIVAVVICRIAFALMNTANDATFYGGLLLLLAIPLFYASGCFYLIRKASN